MRAMPKRASSKTHTYYGCLSGACLAGFFLVCLCLFPGERSFAAVVADESDSPNAALFLNRSDIVSRPLPSLPELEQMIREEPVPDSPQRASSGRDRRRSAVASSDSFPQKLLTLRDAYVRLWAEQRRQPLLVSFLADRDGVMNTLRARAQKKLLPEYSLLECASFFDFADRELIRSRANAFRALMSIAGVTGQRWSLPENPELPLLPAIEYLRRDIAGNRPSAGDKLEEHLLWSDYARESLRYETTRLAGAREKVRQYALRHETLAGETFEQLTESRSAFLRAAMDLIDAESLALRTFVELVSFVSSGEKRTSSDGVRIFPLPDIERRNELLYAPLLTTFPVEPFVVSARPSQQPIVLPPLSSVLPESSGALKENRAEEVPVVGKKIEPESESEYKNERTPDVPAADQEILPSVAPAAPVLSQESQPKPIEKPRPVTDPGHNVLVGPGRWSPRHRAVYVWDAGPFLSEEQRDGALDRVRENRFTRMLVSFSPRELENLQTPEGMRRLKDFLNAASAGGVAADLLLAESTWTTPSGRRGLQKLLEFFRPFPFRAVHLDLDPELRPASVGREAFAGQVVETVRLAVAAAGRPVGITLRPGEFEGRTGRSMMDALSRMNLSEIVVAFYSTDAEAVVERFRSICRTWPALRFSLAQSVESDLPRSESYFSSGVFIFEQRMRRLCFDIAVPNAADLVYQSWEHYLNMGR